MTKQANMNNQIRVASNNEEMLSQCKRSSSFGNIPLPDGQGIHRDLIYDLYECIHLVVVIDNRHMSEQQGSEDGVDARQVRRLHDHHTAGVHVGQQGHLHLPLLLRQVHLLVGRQGHVTEWDGRGTSWWDETGLAGRTGVRPHSGTGLAEQQGISRS